MNISSASSTAVSSTGSTSSTSKTSSSKSSSASFDEELKNASKTEEAQETENSAETETENKTEKTAQEEKTSKQDDADKKNDDKNKESNTLKGEVTQNELLSTEELLAQNIQAMFNNGKNNSIQNQYQRLNIANIDELSRTLTAQIDYTSINMDMNDALFFSNLAQNTDMSMKSVAAEIQNLAENNAQQAQKTANVSATLMNALNEGLKTNQPFRINFDKDISVIIKINKDGSIAANFIPGDKAVEEYLKMNISTLRQRFDDQELSYSELSYSSSRREQEQENNKRKNKENSHE